MHTRERVLHVGGRMCHSHPTHMLTSSMATIFQHTLEASCECVLFCTKFLSECEEVMKLVTYNMARQIRLVQPFNDWIIKFMMALLKVSSSLKR